MMGSNLVRSYSSPDLVTEGSGDDWVGDVVDGVDGVPAEDNVILVDNATVGFDLNKCDNTTDNDNRRKVGEED